MKDKLSPFLLSITGICCKLFGHQFRVSKNVTNYIKEYQCCRCGEEVTDTANGLLARLTPKFRETNEFLAQIHERRRKKRFYSEAS